MTPHSSVKSRYAPEAVSLPAAGTDEREPGAVITTALCGSLKHTGPCPLAPHHTATRREEKRLIVRVLFVVDPQHEHAVREQIAAKRAQSDSREPHGHTATWGPWD
jgi:hypothetical protein